MSPGSMEFMSALFAIVMIYIALAGDNAIVIALAARNLEAKWRRRAIVWGTVGAVGVRCVMTLAVVWLLGIPGLMAAGGLVLVWIAWKLLSQDGAGHEIRPAATFWSAMQTIVIADAAMGLDNVLAVAGAAHGSFALVVIGLLISIPIVVGGSALLMRLLERFRWIIHVAVAIIAWTAASMIAKEPLLEPFLRGNAAATIALYAAIVGGLPVMGMVRARRLARRRGAYTAPCTTASGSTATRTS